MVSKKKEEVTYDYKYSAWNWIRRIGCTRH